MPEDDLEKVREEKLKQLSQKVGNPYANTFLEAKPLEEIKNNFAKFEKKTVKVAGRIMAERTHGKSTFLDIQGQKEKLQVYFKSDLLGEENYELLKLLDLGDHIGVEGEVFKTRTGEVTVVAKSFLPLTKCLHPLPQKWYGLQDVEKRYRQRYLDLIMNPEVRNIFALRSQVIRDMRSFLDNRQFMEVETPMMQAVAGGALARPFVTFHNALGIDLFLRIAPELYLKRLVVGGYEKIYEINRNFRNEGTSTRHNPEFTMLELYWAYADYKKLMKLTESMLNELILNLKGKKEFPYQGQTIKLPSSWERITYQQALQKYSGIDITGEEKEVRKQALKKGVQEKGSFWKVLDAIFKKFVVPNLIQPTFVIDYPLSLSPLAKESTQKGIVERFQPFIGGLELGNAYTELNDPREQKERFLKQQKERESGEEEAHQMDEDFVTALEFAMPPTAGLGIGIDRLVMLLADVKSIREVILFPLLKPEASE